MKNDKPKMMKPVPPFVKFVCANVPMVFDDSLSYYEALSALWKYISDTVDVINNNALLEEEFIVKFNELKDFVDNYFDNLDVQDEVNNKLDEMVESGELGELVQIAISLINYQKSVLVQKIINNSSARVACAGDSLTWCQKPGDTSTQLTTWASMLQDFINEWYNNENLLTVENYGVKGEVSSASISNFNTYIQNSPDTIFWAYGTNDMTQNVTVDQFMANLKAFYEKCIENNVELIVIISPPSFQSMARREKMLNLRNAEIVFCQKYGIRYIDMFEYVENLYSTDSATQNVLQSDNTHFSDYTCYRDAILSELFSCIFKQNNKVITYVPVANPRNYLHTNGQQIVVSGEINPLKYGYRWRQGEEENYITINLQLDRKSKIYLITYGNNSAGKVDLTIDGVAGGTIDTQLHTTSSSTTNTNLEERLQLGGIHNAGLHQITLNNPDYTDSVGSGRVYVFGFIIEEITEPMFHNRYWQYSKQSLLWSGNETSLDNVDLLQDATKYNKILVQFGGTSGGLEVAEIYPHDVFNFFGVDGANVAIPYRLIVNNGGNVECCTVTINHSTNKVSFSSTSETLAIRKIVGLVTQETQGYNAKTMPYIEAGIDWQ